MRNKYSVRQIIFASALSFFGISGAMAEECLLTDSAGGVIGGRKFAWHIADGVLEYCNDVNCATPRTQPDPIPCDAGLYLLPNAGLWIMTPDGRFQSFCGIEPNCLPPRTRLARLPEGKSYSFRATNDNKLSVTDPRTGQSTWCSYEPNCSPI